MNKVIKSKVFTLNTNGGRYTITAEIRKKTGPLLTWTLEEVESGEELSITADVVIYGAGNSYGQCRDAVREAADEHGLINLEELCDLWDEYHLNDMRAGTYKQYQIAAGKNYDDARKALEEANLLVDDGYEYGTKWLYEPLPDYAWDVVEAAALECTMFEDESMTEEDRNEELADACHISVEILKGLAEHLGCSMEDAVAYHQENYQGEHRDDEEFAEDLADQLGYEIKNDWPHRYIDWEAAARDLMMDYFEIDGHYYRST